MATNNTSAFVTAVLALLAIVLALATSGVTAADTDSNQPTPVVQTNSGKVVGVVEQGFDNKPIYAFKGIPYAADPSGSNRWLPPQDPESWPDVRNTSTWGNICPQVDPGKEHFSRYVAKATGQDISSKNIFAFVPLFSFN